jgi:Trp operon repressor
MQDYLIVKGQIDLIENAMAPATYKPKEWTWKDWIARATIRMHLSESVYYMVQSCNTAHALWQLLLTTNEKKTVATKIYLVRRLYNLRMKESDSIMAHLYAYETIIAQLSSQGMTIEEELRALILLSNLPPSRETFVTTICNATSTAMTYASATGAILSEDARRKLFEQNTSRDAYTVQNIGDQHNRSQSFSRGPNTSWNGSKSHDKRICNYCKKPGHIKADCRALKVKIEKA